MELVSMGVGLLVNTLVKNKEVNSAVDDFISDSVKWVRGWFKKKDKDLLINKLEASPDSVEAKQEVSTAMGDMLSDETFKTELQKWIAESKKPNPSIKNVITKKNVVEDANVEVGGSVKIGDKTAGEGEYDQKNVIKNSNIKAGGDFTLGDGF